VAEGRVRWLERAAKGAKQLVGEGRPGVGWY